MNTIKTIDLWTEQSENHIECFNGAFIDGFENGNIPFDSYKVIKNGNCIIISNRNDLNISNKHNAIVFYKNGVPTRLMVINQNTNIDNCIDIALNQSFNGFTLNELYRKLLIKRYDIDLRQQPIQNNANKKLEIDVGSCDRPSLLSCMLEGCYTQSDTNYGKSNSDNNYHFIPDIFIQYDFSTDTEPFKIEHRCAFLNENMTRIIPLQENSLLNIEEIITLFNKNMIIKEFSNHDDLVDFYISRGIEFNKDKQYFHPPVFSYIAEVDNNFVGAITICKEGNDFILDEVAVIEGKEKQGICTALVNTVINRIEQEYKDSKFYLVAKNSEVFKSMGFNFIQRNEAPSFSECFSCPDFQKKCFPEIMVKVLKK